MDRDEPEAVARAVVDRLVPSLGRGLVLNLVYVVGFVRVLGEREGALATDRQGTGKLYRGRDQRAEQTIGPMLAWLRDGASHPKTVASVARVQAIHDAFAKRYEFSNETYLHALASFTVLFDEMLQILGIDALSASEKEALVEHWRSIGAQMRIRDIPTSWEGMQRVLRAYEDSPEWYSRTDAGVRGAEALVQQFEDRWFPRRLRPLGRLIALALIPPHVLEVVGLPRPRGWQLVGVRFVLRQLVRIQLSRS